MTVFAPRNFPSFRLHLGIVVRVLLPSDASHHLLEYLLHIVPQGGRGLKERTAKLFCHQLSLVCRDLTTVLKVALVSSDHHGNGLVVTDSIDHLFVATDLLEASLIRYGVDEDESLPSSHVLFPHRSELILNVVWEEEEEKR